MKSSDQLKALLRNLSKEKLVRPQVLLQHYLLERLLERISVSKYCSKIILKGGMLISSLVGLEARSTMDIDTTFCNHSFSETSIYDALKEIASIDLNDGSYFNVVSIKKIRDHVRYPSFRLSLSCTFHEIKQQLKIDVTTGDVITPNAIDYQYRLMFESRNIDLKTYNIETIFAEKLETVISRGILNTRMRDFYDLYSLNRIYSSKIDSSLLKKAFEATSKNRDSYKLWELKASILQQIRQSITMKDFWKQYQKHFSYSETITWTNVMDEVEKIFQSIDT
jgi:predicted nucleotidyltransferase component of viral defense system